MYFFLTTILLLNASVSGTKMDFFKGLVVTLKEIFELAITGKTDRVHPEAIMTTVSQ